MSTEISQTNTTEHGESVAHDGIYHDFAEYIEKHKLQIKESDALSLSDQEFNILALRLMLDEKGVETQFYELDGKLLLMVGRHITQLHQIHQIIDLSDLPNDPTKLASVETLPVYDCVLQAPGGVVSAKERAKPGIQMKYYPRDVSEEKYQYGVHKWFVDPSNTTLGLTEIWTLRELALLWHEIGHSQDNTTEEESKEQSSARLLSIEVSNLMASGTYSNVTLTELEQKYAMSYIEARYLVAKSESFASDWAYSDQCSLAGTTGFTDAQLAVFLEVYETNSRAYDAQYVPEAASSEKGKQLSSQEAVDCRRRLDEVYLHCVDTVKALELTGQTLVLQDTLGNSFTFSKQGQKIQVIVSNGSENSRYSYEFYSPHTFQVNQLGVDEAAKPQVTEVFSQTFFLSLVDEHSVTPEHLRQTIDYLNVLDEMCDYIATLTDDQATDKCEYLLTLDPELIGVDPLERKIQLITQEDRVLSIAQSLAVILKGDRLYPEATPQSRLSELSKSLLNKTVEKFGMNPHEFDARKYSILTGRPLITAWDKLVETAECILSEKTDFDVSTRASKSTEEYEKKAISKCLVLQR